MKKIKPTFVSNRANGDDLYEGKSQARLALAISQHITRMDEQYPSEDSPVIPRLIGLEGPWGCGKSNVVAQMKTLLGDDYYFFTYDAWGHQEDLQRRSLLEQLTSSLITDKVLQGKTKLKHLIEKKDTHDLVLKTQTCSWEDRLQTLVARKSYTRNYTIPKLNNDSKCFALLLLVLGFTITYTNSKDFPNDSWWLRPLAVLAPLLVFFCYLFIKGCCQYKSSKDILKPIREMWAFYSTNSTSDTTSYSISQLEPSEREFREWMQDVNDGITKNTHLVIVFDNMDRLPAEKVKQLWSSINTFFAEKGYPKVWCMIPFDKKHLASAFGENPVGTEETSQNEVGTNTTSLFIEKTFPIVYRVPEPVITDYKEVFKSLFVQAFPTELVPQSTLDVISAAYRKINSKPNVRHIITFINKLVACYNQWGDKISLGSMSLFLLYKDELISNPEKAILDKVYLQDSTIDRLFGHNAELQTEISALVYGVDKDIANQLPLKRYLQEALSSGTAVDINKYVQENCQFFEILHELIVELDTDTQLYNAIKVLDLIDNTSVLDREWVKLNDYYKEKSDKEYVAFDLPFIKLLLKHLPFDKITDICDWVLGRQVNEQTITGKDIFELLTAVKGILKDRKQAYDFHIYTLLAPAYFEYLSLAGKSYRDYPVETTKEGMESYCLDRVQNGQDLRKEFKLLKGDDRYTYNSAIKYLKEYLLDKEASEQRVASFLKMLKVLQDCVIDFPDGDYSHLRTLWNQMDVNNEVYLDLYVLLSMQGESLSALSEEQLKGLDTVIVRYTTIADLIDCYKQHDTSACKCLLKHSIENEVLDDSCPDDSLLLTIDNLAVQLGCTYQQVVKYVNDWGYTGLGAIDKTLVLESIFGDKSKVDSIIGIDNQLGEAITLKFRDELEQQELSEFINSRNDTFTSSSYWGNVLVRLVQKHKIALPLSAKLNKIAERLLKAIENQYLTSLPEDSVENFLVSNVEYKNVSTMVTEIVTDFTNRQSTLTPSVFKLLHRFIEETDVNGQYAGFLNFCMLGLIGNKECQNIILQNKKFYANIISGNLDDASELKTGMIEIKEDESYPNKDFQTFVSSFLKE